MSISDRMGEWRKAAAAGALCGPGGHAVVGGSAGGLPHLHIPPIGELLALGATIAVFIAAGLWMYRRFDTAEATSASAATQVDGPATPPPAELEAWQRREREVEEREPVGV